ncbi:zinc finger lsd1 subclass family protein, putative, partial [Ichthyophthirius multifiliis]
MHTVKKQFSEINLCGLPDYDSISKSYYSVYTNSQNVLITFINNLDKAPYYQSLGINEFEIYANECMSECVGCDNEYSCNECQVGQYLEAGRCFNCIANCEQCSKRNSCDLCKIGYLYNDPECILICPNNKFKDSITRTCNDCNFKCATCSNATDCDTCFENRELPNCGCLAHNYDNLNYQQACFACSNISFGCSTCDNNICHACLPPRFLDESSCVTVCPPGKWKNMTNRQCIPCLAKCLTCSNATDCDTCFQNRVPPDCGCLAHNYDNLNYQQACFACSNISFGCSTCDNNICHECLPLRFLDENSCVNDCPPGKWKNTINRQCIACLAKCETCSNDISCDTCFQNRVPQQCVCPQYSYDPKDFNQACTMCSAFSSGCATCSANECLTCLTPYYFQLNLNIQCDSCLTIMNKIQFSDDLLSLIIDF